MSRLTPCNYCTLKSMEAQHKGKVLVILAEDGWLAVYARPPHMDEADFARDKDKLSLHTSFLALTTKCCC